MSGKTYKKAASGNDLDEVKLSAPELSPPWNFLPSTRVSSRAAPAYGTAGGTELGLGWA
jgi:hypothetical protein